MQITLSPAHVVSRVLAVLLLAMPLVYLTGALNAAEQELIGKLSHQELLEYLRQGQAGTFTEQYLVIAFQVLLLVALAEAVAFGVRYGLRLFPPHAPLGGAPGRSAIDPPHGSGNG